jgi:hypothetical protein
VSVSISKEPKVAQGREEDRGHRPSHHNLAYHPSPCARLLAAWMCVCVCVCVYVCMYLCVIVYVCVCWCEPNCPLITFFLVTSFSSFSSSYPVCVRSVTCKQEIKNKHIRLDNSAACSVEEASSAIETSRLRCCKHSSASMCSSPYVHECKYV